MTGGRVIIHSKRPEIRLELGLNNVSLLYLYLDMNIQDININILIN